MMFNGAVSLSDIKNFSYKEACKFYLDALNLAKARANEIDKIKKKTP